MKASFAVGAVAIALSLMAYGLTPTKARSMETTKLQLLKFGEDNTLLRPEGLERWVFLGTTMGMTYFDEQPDPSRPGLFSSIFIEPEAYEHFEQTGTFADGTAFVKIVRETMSEEGGFFMGDELGIEVHVKDRQRFPKHGYNFYFLPAGANEAAAMPEDNACVACHAENAAFDNVFTQYYPKMRKRLQ